MGTFGQVKEFDISKNNRVYYDMFLNRFKAQSRATYKVNVGAFLNELGTNDFAKITPERMLQYANSRSENQKKNAIAHLRSMMVYIVKNNINGATEKVRKETLIWLLDNRAGGELQKMDQIGLFNDIK